jgi:hypothetical protein
VLDEKSKRSVNGDYSVLKEINVDSLYLPILRSDAVFDKQKNMSVLIPNIKLNSLRIQSKNLRFTFLQNRSFYFDCYLRF